MRMDNHLSCAKAHDIMNEATRRAKYDNHECDVLAQEQA